MGQKTFEDRSRISFVLISGVVTIFILLLCLFLYPRLDRVKELVSIGISNILLGEHLNETNTLFSPLATQTILYIHKYRKENDLHFLNIDPDLCMLANKWLAQGASAEENKLDPVTMKKILSKYDTINETKYPLKSTTTAFEIVNYWVQKNYIVSEREYVGGCVQTNDSYIILVGGKK